MHKEQGSVSLVLAVVFCLLFIGSSVFGIWAFSGRQDYKDNVEEKIDTAVELAVQEAESAKEAEFTEREKTPTRTYTGPSTYGSVSFEYPKTWSVYQENSNRGTVVNVYAHREIVPGTSSDQPYALRLRITSNSYDDELSSIQRDIDSGDLRSTAFRPDKVSDALGIKIEGEIERGLNGQAVYLPLRDRTIILSTEVARNFDDFNTIILPSLTYIP